MALDSKSLAELDKLARTLNNLEASARRVLSAGAARLNIPAAQVEAAKRMIVNRMNEIARANAGDEGQ